jgi:hypothetical protein
VVLNNVPAQISPDYAYRTAYYAYPSKNHTEEEGAPAKASRWSFLSDLFKT